MKKNLLPIIVFATLMIISGVLVYPAKSYAMTDNAVSAKCAIALDAYKDLLNITYKQAVISSKGAQKADLIEAQTIWIQRQEAVNRAQYNYHRVVVGYDRSAAVSDCARLTDYQKRIDYLKTYSNRSAPRLVK